MTLFNIGELIKCEECSTFILLYSKKKLGNTYLQNIFVQISIHLWYKSSKSTKSQKDNLEYSGIYLKKYLWKRIFHAHLKSKFHTTPFPSANKYAFVSGTSRMFGNAVESIQNALTTTSSQMCFAENASLCRKRIAEIKNKTIVITVTVMM